MAQQAFVVTGLGYGDEGKGKTTHWLCAKHRAHTVIRTGGPQAFHRNVTSDGREHVHAQFGSGTLAGAATHLSRNMVIEPYAILSEGKALQELGVTDVFEKLTIHEDALVITPFQAIANRLRELTRGKSRISSVGVGVGETVLDSEVLSFAVRAKDLRSSCLFDKLRAIQKRKVDDLEKVLGKVGELSSGEQERACFEAANLKSKETLEWAMGWFKEFASRVKIVNSDYVATEILGRDGTVIFEGSQGILLDRWHGFHPYTTKVRTVPETAWSIMREGEYEGEVQGLGVLRAYYTRHGNGPFVTESKQLTKRLPDAANGDHPWQGNFRVGHFDAVAAKYAIEVCHGARGLDGLVITCADRIKSLREWSICPSYSGPVASNFFSQNKAGEIDGMFVFHREGVLERQEELGRLLSQCSPNLSTFSIKKDTASLCSGVLSERLGIPVVAVSIGPTEQDCIEIKNGQYR